MAYGRLDGICPGCGHSGHLGLVNTVAVFGDTQTPRNTVFCYYCYWDGELGEIPGTDINPRPNRGKQSLDTSP